MKKIIFVFILVVMAVPTSYAACPSGWEEVPMENIEFTSANSCPANTESYLSIDNECDANVL